MKRSKKQRKKMCFCFDQVTHLLGVLSHTQKGSRFNPQSRHIFRLQVLSPVKEHGGGNLPVHFSHIMFLILSLNLSLSPFQRPGFLGSHLSLLCCRKTKTRGDLSQGQDTKGQNVSNIPNPSFLPKFIIIKIFG